MAQLKDTIINGDLSISGSITANNDAGSTIINNLQLYSNGSPTTNNNIPYCSYDTELNERIRFSK